MVVWAGSSFGNACNFSLLPDEDLQELLSDYPGHTQQELAKALNVSQKTITRGFASNGEE